MVREEMIDAEAAIDDETRALRLADGREGPGADDRHLPSQHVVADVERNVAALADKARLAPGAYTAHGLCARLR